MIICVATVLAVALGCVIRTEHKIEAHITMDIRHVAEQVETVLDYVEGKTDELPVSEESPDAESEPVSELRRILNALNPIQTAYASELSVTTSPLAREIAEKMRARNSKIESLKKQGCLGETNRGYVELRDCDAVKDADKRNEVQKLIADENKDRKALYAEIARLNRQIEGINVGKVENIFAMQRLRRAKSGEIFQLPPAGADFDAIKNENVGKKLGDKCVPGTWVTIP